MSLMRVDQSKSSRASELPFKRLSAMNQSHQQLLEVSREYNTLFSKNEFYPIQKAYTSPHFIILTVRFPGKNAYIYIGRGHKYEGIYLGESLLPAYLRIQDKFLDYLRKNLVGCRLGRMEVDSKHSFALFSFKNDYADNSISFGYKNHQLFFIIQNKDNIYTSWNNENHKNSTLLSLVDQFYGEKVNATNDKFSTWSLKDYFKSEEKKLNGQPVLLKKEKFLSRKIANIENDLNEVKKWSLLEKELLSENPILYSDEQNHFAGIKIKIPHGLNQWQKRDFLFGKVKKLKKAEEILINRLEETIKEKEKVKAGDIEVTLTKESAVPLLWQTTRSKKKNETNLNYIQFKLKNIAGAAGLDAHSNDLLRPESSKDHYWFHIENFPGAHCLLKTDDISILTKEDFSGIASLLRDLSHLEILEIPVIYSQVKYVKGLKGTPGKVLVKKPKYMRCNYGPWKEIISVV